MLRVPCCLKITQISCREPQAERLIREHSTFNIQHSTLNAQGGGRKRTAGRFGPIFSSAERGMRSAPAFAGTLPPPLKPPAGQAGSARSAECKKRLAGTLAPPATSKADHGTVWSGLGHAKKPVNTVWNGLVRFTRRQIHRGDTESTEAERRRAKVRIRACKKGRKFA